jgi:hypothetical protein
MVSKGEETMENKLWYAILLDHEDNDWGTGSHDREEAVKMCRNLQSVYPDAYIAVINEETNVCIKTILVL